MRRYLIVLALATILPAAGFVGVGWLVDPYRIFHKPWVRDDYYPNDSVMRVEASGIINTEEFASVILGTSMAANFSPAEASRVFGNRFVNISLDGASVAERAVVLNRVLHTKNIREVVYSLDGLQNGPAAATDTPIAPHLYLYDDNRWNDLLIYASNLRFLRYVFCRNLLVPGDLFCKNTRDLETLVEWYSDPDHNRRFGGLKKWLEAKNNSQIRGALEDISKSIRTINRGESKAVDRTAVKHARTFHEDVFRTRFLAFAKDYPETRFYIFFPPYSRLNYAIKKQTNPQEFEIYLDTIRLVVEAAAAYPNVRVFGFDREPFVDDLANYKDTGHYHPLYNSRILHWMKNGEHELTVANLDAYIDDITGRAANFPIQEIGARIDAYLRDMR
jgi:hypothetical protein